MTRVVQRFSSTRASGDNETARKAASTAALRTRPPALRRSTKRTWRSVGLAFALALAGDGFLRWLLGLFRLLRLWLALLLDRRELDLAVRQLHEHGVAGAELRGQQRFRQRVLDQPLDHAPQRAGAVDLVVAFLGQVVLGLA